MEDNQNCLLSGTKFPKTHVKKRVKLCSVTMTDYSSHFQLSHIHIYTVIQKSGSTFVITTLENLD